MTKHVEKRNLPYTPEQLFTLVAEVDKYQDFLPWCQSSIIKRREDNVFYADLVIGYKRIREKFGSKVTLNEPHRIDVEYLSGPMKYLKTTGNSSANRTAPVQSTFTSILNSKTSSFRTSWVSFSMN